MDAANFGDTLPKSVPNRVHRVLLIPVIALGLALSLFLVVSYLICVTTYFISGLPISHAMLTIFLPGFVLLNLQSFFLGFVESFAGGWFFALIFGPLYNFFACAGLEALPPVVAGLGVFRCQSALPAQCRSPEAGEHYG